MHDNIICFNPSSLHLFEEAVTVRKKMENSCSVRSHVADYSKEKHSGSVGRVDLRSRGSWFESLTGSTVLGPAALYWFNPGRQENVRTWLKNG